MRFKIGKLVIFAENNENSKSTNILHVLSTTRHYFYEMQELTGCPGLLNRAPPLSALIFKARPRPLTLGLRPEVAPPIRTGIRSVHVPLPLAAVPRPRDLDREGRVAAVGAEGEWSLTPPISPVHVVLFFDR